MNIYIKPELEALLRQEDSMSGLINQLLLNHYTQNRIDNTRDQLAGLPKKHPREIGLPAISPSAGDHQTSNPVQPKKISTPAGPLESTGTPRSGLEPLYRNKKKGKI
jgi:hypothetical protein